MKWCLWLWGNLCGTLAPADFFFFLHTSKKGQKIWGPLRSSVRRSVRSSLSFFLSRKTNVLNMRPLEASRFYKTLIGNLLTIPDSVPPESSGSFVWGSSASWPPEASCLLTFCQQGYVRIHQLTAPAGCSVPKTREVILYIPPLWHRARLYKHGNNAHIRAMLVMKYGKVTGHGTPSNLHVMQIRQWKTFNRATDDSAFFFSSFFFKRKYKP